MLSLLGSVYWYGGLITFALVALDRSMSGYRAGESPETCVSSGAVLGIIGAILWPVLAVSTLMALQDEYGIFWKAEGWQPQSQIILDILRVENREMRSKDILEKSSGRLNRNSIYIRLFGLVNEGSASVRKETYEEAGQRRDAIFVDGKPLRVLWFKITDEGRGRRVSQALKVHSLLEGLVMHPV